MNLRKRILLGFSTTLLGLCAYSLARADDPPPTSRTEKPAATGDRSGPAPTSRTGRPAATGDRTGPANPAPGRNERGPAHDDHGSGRDVRGPGPGDRGPGGPQGDRSRSDRPGPGDRSPSPDFGRPVPGGARQPNDFQDPRGRMPQVDPEMQKLLEADFNLDRESHKLAEEFRHASKDKQDDIKKNLQEIVTKQFVGRQERRTLELKRLEDEIKRIRESIDKRNDGKQQIVDRRVSELLGQDDTSF
jgi:hypothetical protein